LLLLRVVVVRDRDRCRALGRGHAVAAARVQGHGHRAVRLIGIVVHRGHAVADAAAGGYGHRLRAHGRAVVAALRDGQDHRQRRGRGRAGRDGEGGVAALGYPRSGGHTDLGGRSGRRRSRIAAPLQPVQLFVYLLPQLVGAVPLPVGRLPVRAGLQLRHRVVVLAPHRVVGACEGLHQVWPRPVPWVPGLGLHLGQQVLVGGDATLLRRRVVVRDHDRSRGLAGGDGIAAAHVHRQGDRAVRLVGIVVRRGDGVCHAAAGGYRHRLRSRCRAELAALYDGHRDRQRSRGRRAGADREGGGASLGDARFGGHADLRRGVRGRVVVVRDGHRRRAAVVRHGVALARVHRQGDRAVRLVGLIAHRGDSVLCRAARRYVHRRRSRRRAVVARLSDGYAHGKGRLRRGVGGDGEGGHAALGDVRSRCDADLRPRRVIVVRDGHRRLALTGQHGVALTRVHREGHRAVLLVGVVVHRGHGVADAADGGDGDRLLAGGPRRGVVARLGDGHVGRQRRIRRGVGGDREGG